MYDHLVYFQDKISEDINMIDSLVSEFCLIDLTAATVASHGITDYGKEMMSSMYGDMINLSSVKDLAQSLEGLVNDIWEGIKKFFKSIWDSIINMLTRGLGGTDLSEEIKKAKQEGADRARDTFLEKDKLNSRSDNFMKKSDLLILIDKTSNLVSAFSKIAQSKKFEFDCSVLGVTDSELKSIFAAAFKKGTSKIPELKRLDADARDKAFQLQPDEVLYSTTGWEMNADVIDSLEKITNQYESNIKHKLKDCANVVSSMEKDVEQTIEKMQKSSPDNQTMDASTQEQIDKLKTFSKNIATLLAITKASQFVIHTQLNLILKTILFAKAKDKK